MDIESSEWRAIPNMIAEDGFKGIKQFALEIHTDVIKKQNLSEDVVGSKVLNSYLFLL